MNPAPLRVVVHAARARGHHVLEFAERGSHEIDVLIVGPGARRGPDWRPVARALTGDVSLLFVGPRDEGVESEARLLHYSGERIMARLVHGIEAAVAIARGRGLYLSGGASADPERGWGVVEGRLVSLGDEGGRLLARLVEAGPSGVSRIGLADSMGLGTDALDKSLARLRSILELGEEAFSSQGGVVRIITRPPSPDQLALPLPSAAADRLVLVHAAQFVGRFTTEQLIECLEPPDARAAGVCVDALSAEHWLQAHTETIPWRWSVPRRDIVFKRLPEACAQARIRWRSWIQEAARGWLAGIRNGPRSFEARKDAARVVDELVAAAECLDGDALFSVVSLLSELPGLDSSTLEGVVHRAWGCRGSSVEVAVELLRISANVHKKHARFDHGLRQVDEALRLARDRGDLRGRLLVTRAALLHTARRASEAAEDCREAAVLLQGRGEALHGCYRVQVLMERDPARRRELFDRIRAECRSRGDRWMEAIQSGNQAIFLAGIGDVATAIELFTFAIDCLREADDLRYAGVFTSSYANVLLARGAFREAETRYAEAIRHAGAVRNAKSEGIGRANRAAVLLILNRLNEAEQEARVAQALALEHGDFFTAGNAKGVEAHLALLRGDPQAAVDLFTAAAEHFLSAGKRRAVLLARAHAGAVDAARGRASDFPRVTAELLEAYPEDAAIGYVLSALALRPPPPVGRVLDADMVLADRMREALLALGRGA